MMRFHFEVTDRRERSTESKRMKTARLIFIAASIVAPAMTAASAPAATADVQQEKKENDAAKKDIQANAAEIVSDEGKLRDSHAGEKKALKDNRIEEKAALADAAKDKTLTVKGKKNKKDAIRKGMKVERKITREQADADRKPLEKDVRLDKAAVKDDQKNLDVKEAAEKK